MRRRRRNHKPEFKAKVALARMSARQMLTTALNADVADFVSRHASLQDDEGRALVVRKGRGQARIVPVDSGTFRVQSPRVNTKSAGQGFSSPILPSCLCKCPKVSEVLPILYLRGILTDDFKEAPCCLWGEKASVLSPSTISRLTDGCRKAYREFWKSQLGQQRLSLHLG
jgi:hypothetical protein